MTIFIDLTTPKRAADHEINQKFKRPRVQDPSAIYASASVNLDQFALEIIDEISRTFDFDQLMTFSCTSKEISRLSNNSIFWRILCRKAKLVRSNENTFYEEFRNAYMKKCFLTKYTAVNYFIESKNHFLKKNIDRLLCDLSAIRNGEKLFSADVWQSKVRPLITGQMNYLEALNSYYRYQFGNLNGAEVALLLQPQAVTHLSNTNKCFAKFLLNHQRTPPCYNVYVELGDNKSIATWLHLEAKRETVWMNFKHPSSLLADANAVTMCLEIYNEARARSTTQAFGGVHAGNLRV